MLNRIHSKRNKKVLVVSGGGGGNDRLSLSPSSDSERTGYIFSSGI
jgi:hypothetical protein